jgi:2-phospho-L-lactate guanylyltransferase
MTGMHSPRSTIIIPVKRLAAGKSRLRGAQWANDELVLAIALDTIAAVLAAEPVESVLVVTNDPTLSVAAGALGAKIAPDTPDAGLNAAIVHGEATLGTSVARAVCNGDLPALRPAELTAALITAREDGAGGSSAPRRRYVADHMGTGTTLLWAPPGVPLDPHFGLGSSAAHAASGAVPLDGDWPSLRLDVDTPADLAAARALGLGARTGHMIGGVQGTVATYDPDSRNGTVLLDDGTEVAFDAAAFATSGLRQLRLGQRLRLVLDADGTVVQVAIPTM